mmetsp:Transcript_10663/g.15611  ORF Transcript_10663/g.15611 Transcript_10663/m.15611 type:complete len:99 (-) Transcript_10663:67-363(-)
MLPPQHLYEATVENKDNTAQKVTVVYDLNGKTKTVTKEAAANATVTFPQEVEQKDDSATHSYAITSIQVGSNTLQGPFVEAPTKTKHFHVVSGAVKHA